ncbi:MAG: SDR family oxidoreductase [Micromonosporaceae bacterium]|nr:SDR family oxidoreductase [Micromonosporaceae bacterium]
MRLEDKCVIVTGGLRGLGRTLTRRFLEEGARVVCAARVGRDLERLIAQYGDRVRFEQVDVSDLTSVTSMVDRAAGHFGVPDVLVANAGIHVDGLIHRVDPAGWSKTVDTNVNGVFHCVHAVAPLMLDRGAGRIITVSSIMGSRPTVGAGAYCVSKAAIEMLTRVCALELGARGVLVNCIAPGFVDVGMGARLAGSEKVWCSYQRALALQRVGEPEEVASAAVFLAGEDSSYVNGHVLEVSGGIRWA